MSNYSHLDKWEPLSDEQYELFLKWEKYLPSLHRAITPDKWEYYKTYGCLPPIPKREEIERRATLSSINIEQAIDDWLSGGLSEEDLREIIDKFGDLKLLEERFDELLYAIGFGSYGKDDEKLYDFLESYFE